MNVIARAWASLKGFTMRWSRGSSWGSIVLGSTAYDWKGRAGDGRGNAAVMSCIGAIQRALPEAPLVVKERRGDDVRDVPDHELARLLERPNPYYSGMHLLSAVAADFKLSGNAYVLKARNGSGRPVELWWVPSTMIEPEWPDDGSAFISHYEYAVDGRAVRIEPDDCIHFRNGFDPGNLRKGVSELGALVREIATDNEAANMTASLLRNQAIPGVVISPDGQSGLNEGDAEQIKTMFRQKFGGDRAGEPLVMDNSTRVSVLSFSPEQMDLKSLRRIPEERIAAALGVPAIVAGLGAGLDRSTYSNMAEAREAFYESCLIPLQRLLAAEIQQQLVPDFDKTARLRVEFDLSQVRVLQTDQNALHDRVRADLAAGGITLNQFLQETGREPIPNGDVRYLPSNYSVKPADDLLPAPVPAALQEPTPLRALPSPVEDEAVKSRRPVETKGIEDIPELLDLLRQDEEPLWQKILEDYLSEQLARVLERLTEGAATAELLMPSLEATLLREVLRPKLRATLEAVRRIAVAELGIDFNLPDPAVRDYLREAGANIQGITETTRDAIRAALAAGQAEGEGIPQLARRLRGLPAFNDARARVVSRTELGHSQNAATLASYRASSVVVGVRVLDGDSDAACQAINGRTFPLDKAPPTLQHPNCVRAFAPIVDVSEIEDVA